MIDARYTAARHGLGGVIAVLAFFCARAAAGAHFHSASWGYSLSVPTGWVRVPDDVLREAVSAMRNPKANSPLVHDAAFQLPWRGQQLEYPYVVVMVLPYANLGISRQINEDEFPEVIKAATGADMGKVLDSALSPEARRLVGDAELGKPQLDAGRRRFLLSTRMSVGEVGKVRALIAGYFGREAIVQVGFFAKEGDWDRYVGAGQGMVDSLRFDPGTEYSDAIAKANPSRRSIWSGVGEKALSGAIVGIIAGVVGYVVSRFRKKEDGGAKQG
jgi:hypothetical protein